MGFSLMPRNDSYFLDFDEAIALVAKIAARVEQDVSASPIPDSLLPAVIDLEAQADVITARCLARLDNSFVTPIEREDIHALITNIDEVADDYEGFVTAINVYGVRDGSPELRKMCTAMRDLVDALVTAVGSVRHLEPSQVRAATRRAKDLEDVIDDVHRESLRALFRADLSARDLVAWKDLYDRIEDTSDQGRRVALIIEHIMVRHS